MARRAPVRAPRTTVARRGHSPVILVTGFGPYRGVARNPSGDVAARLENGRIGDVRIRSIVLPVARAEGWSRLARAITRFRPRAVVALGVAPRRRSIDVEKRSHNRDAFRLPDEHGDHPRGEPIVDGPETLETRLPVAALAATLRRRDLPARVSRDAGRFVCNHVYHRLLTAASGGAFEALFIHLPLDLAPAEVERGVRAVVAVVAGTVAPPVR